MRRAAIIPLLAFVGLASVAAALPPPLQPCEQSVDAFGDHVRWVDYQLQDGAILKLANTRPGDVYRYTFEDCRSGRQLRILLTPTQSGDWDGKVEPVRDAFYTAINSDKTYTMRDMRAAFRKAGYKTQLNTSATESCGCNAYYPQLRGDKKPYEATQ